MAKGLGSPHRVPSHPKGSENGGRASGPDADPAHCHGPVQESASALARKHSSLNSKAAVPSWAAILTARDGGAGRRFHCGRCLGGAPPPARLALELEALTHLPADAHLDASLLGRLEAPVAHGVEDSLVEDLAG